MSELVTLSLEGSLGMITLNRPKAANALSTEVMEAIIAKAQAVSRESAVRVVILTGAGKHFCGGADLREKRDEGGGGSRSADAGPAGRGGSLKALSSHSAPDLRRGRGRHAVAAPAWPTCDFRIAGETARTYPEIDQGMNLQWGGPP